MALMGLLLIAGSALSSFGNILFPVDVLVGTHASVAGMAFGAGICLAAWNPSQNISWVRISILYAVLVLVYDVIAGFAFGAPFQVIPFVIALIFAGLLIFLYPHRADLVPHEESTPMHTGSAQGARA